MAFIRDRSEELTGYQNSSDLFEEIDNNCDFVMVYGMSDSTAERIAQWKTKGYVIHLMVGISWGYYIDYLNGDYDGKNHWDEAQTDRWGNRILHGKNCPYMVPTISFAAYMSEKLKKAVDLGVEAIHVEEPEFWYRGGYSESFKREYEMYYKTKWAPPHSSVDARFKCGKLKQYLYTRTIDTVSSAVKDYSLSKYGKATRFYVPTHSILNYTQWKIVSPEGKLADIPCVDGCIAQVWTGTSREQNWFNGIRKERTFETAYLEYGVMQELVKGTGRKMWFLHDPIEDNPVFDWNDYRKNYLCTVSASLLHPEINTFEICPWPSRVFTGKYPRDAEDATTIPQDYATLLNNMFNTLGSFSSSQNSGNKVGILMADSQLYQRDYPDSEFGVIPEEQVGTVLVESESFIEYIKDNVVNAKTPDRTALLKYMSSSSFPAFYALSMPLLKYGVEIRPVLLDNIRRYPGYLDDCSVLIASYEYLKPEYPDMNTSLAEWVRQGGTLVYVGDGSDPYHKIRSWWTGKYLTPAEHLFEMLGIHPKKEREIFVSGKGKVGVWKINPCYFSYSKENADSFREFYKELVPETQFKNHITMERDGYVVSAVMDESISDEPLTLEGCFADMYAPAFDIVASKTIAPGQSTLLRDLKKTHGTEIIGTSVRINSLTETSDEILLSISGAGKFMAHIRLKCADIISAEIDGTPCVFSYDAKSGTALLSFDSVTGCREIILKKAK